MLNPPVQFRQMWVAQWGSSALVAALWWVFVRMRSPDPVMAGYAAVAGGALAFAWFGWVAWRSTFGSLHGLLAPPILAAMFFWPGSQAMLPATGLGRGQVLAADGVTFFLHFLALGIAAAWHWRRTAATGQVGDADLHWSGVDVSVRKRLLRPAWGAGKFDWVSPSLAAAAGIPAYALLKSMLEMPARSAAVAVLFTTVSAWFYFRFMGRMWGQAFRLRELEKKEPGARFVHQRYAWLQGERDKRFLGRLLKRITAGR